MKKLFEKLPLKVQHRLYALAPNFVLWCLGYRWRPMPFVDVTEHGARVLCSNLRECGVPLYDTRVRMIADPDGPGVYWEVEVWADDGLLDWLQACEDDSPERAAY